MTATRKKSPSEIILRAIVDARSGQPPDHRISDAVLRGEPDLAIDQLNLDSLGIMEFCISVELQSRLELTPAIFASMARVSDVERWIRQRLPNA